MSTTYFIGFICYLLAVLGSIGFGVIYLVRSKSMPYHQEALGLTWQEHDPRLQALLLGLMHTAGGALLGAGIGALIMLIIPFRAGETWSKFTVPLVGLVTAIPALYATIFIRSRTQAHTPIIAGVIAVVFIVLGIIFSAI